MKFFAIGNGATKTGLYDLRNAEYAALDVHILRWMKSLGYDAPKQTPVGKKYKELENIFLNEAKQRNLTPGELDYIIWSNGSGYAGWDINKYKLD